MKKEISKDYVRTVIYDFGGNDTSTVNVQTTVDTSSAAVVGETVQSGVSATTGAVVAEIVAVAT